MVRAWMAVAAAAALVTSVAGPARAGEAKAPASGPTTWRFAGTSLTYPAGWEKVSQKDRGATRVLTLRRSTGAGPVIVALAVTPGPPPLDAAFRTRPAMAAFGFGYPLAKKSAGSAKGEGATASYGVVEFKGGAAPAARIVVPAPGADKRLVMVDAGVQHLGDLMLAAAVITTSKLGDLSDDAGLHAAIGEAYAMLRTFGRDKR